jgi:sugar-specific transcriptional regulator TrmB
MTTPLKELLSELAFQPKEIEIYLLLLELGTQPAGNLAKKVKYPKSTVLFICNNLVKRGVVKKSLRDKTQFFFADPKDLTQSVQKKISNEQKALERVVPLLNEMKNPFSAQPQVTFYEGIEGCRNAYLELLTSHTEILEFGIHGDLVNKLGQNFMDEFIRERVKRNISLRSIANANDIDKKLQKRDRKELRLQRFFPPEEGKTYSSIAIYEQKVLLLNLHVDAFGILIENREVSETLKTIFTLLWGRVPQA